MTFRPTSLSVTDLALSRGDRPLLAGLSLDVAAGEVLWITGPNGTGKTTLLLACAGLLRPDEGEVRWKDHTARTAVAYAAHSGPERDGLRLGEELSFWQSLSGDPVSTGERLAVVGLEGREGTPVSGLSAGQRRRLSLARLMGSGKPAWLMDEPLAGLDAPGRALVSKAIADHVAAGGLALVASHQPVSIDGVTARKLVLAEPI